MGSQATRQVRPEAADTVSKWDALAFDQSVGYLLSDAQRLLYRALQFRLAPHNVAAGAWHFLRAIWREDGLTQRELSQRVGLLEATTGQTLDKLEKAGCIYRLRNSEDRRKINVFLTRRGRDLRPRLLPTAAELNDLALEGFSPREAEQFRTYLTRMRNNLKRLNDSQKADDGAPQPAEP